MRSPGKIPESNSSKDVRKLRREQCHGSQGSNEFQEGMSNYLMSNGIERSSVSICKVSVGCNIFQRRFAGLVFLKARLQYIEERLSFIHSLQKSKCLFCFCKLPIMFKCLMCQVLFQVCEQKSPSFHDTVILIRKRQTHRKWG